MTVAVDTNRWSYTGNGSTTGFAYTNLIFATSNLKVYVDGVLKTLTTHYTVSGALSENGGTVTFLSAPAASAAVVIVRDVPRTQPIDYTANDTFASASHEQGLDRAVILAQQLQDRVDRTLYLDPSDTPAALNALPLKAARASRILGFDADGQPDVMEIADVDVTAVTAYAATLIDDASASEARTTLGLGTMAVQAASAVAITGGTVIGITDLAVADGGTGASTASAARTALGLAIGSDVQAYDADLAAIAALTPTDNNVIVGNGSAWVAESGNTLRTSLGLAIGTDVQAFDTDLATIAANITAAGHAILDDADAAAQRVTMGVKGVRSVQVFTASGTWTKPAGIQSVLVRIRGGGGGGGGIDGAGDRSGGGGGQGEYAEKYIASPGATETVTIGAGGAGGADTGATGSTGGTTSFGAHVTAIGGAGGAGGTALGATRGGAGGGGGAGADLAIAGAVGGSGLQDTNIKVGGNGGGEGGGKSVGGSNPDTAGTRGGGGAGAQRSSSASVGGAGGAGWIIVYEIG